MINFLNATRELALSCGGADVLRIIKFAFILLDLVMYIIPIALIVLLMVDFGKNVMSGKEDEMKKNLNIAIKRIIYCVVLFFVPTIVNFAIGLVSEANSEDNAAVKAAKCIDLARNADKYQLADWEVDYENLDSTTTRSCWKCIDGSGYVLSYEKPSAGFEYSWTNSYNFSKTTCAPGFYDNAVDAIYCIRTEEEKEELEEDLEEFCKQNPNSPKCDDEKIQLD